MTGPQGLGSAPCITVERLCRVAEVSRASFYRHWHETEPRTEETAVRDAIQRLCLAHRHYGYRRIGVLLHRDGWQVNHKRVLRLMRAYASESYIEGGLAARIEVLEKEGAQVAGWLQALTGLVEVEFHEPPAS